MAKGDSAEQEWLVHLLAKRVRVDTTDSQASAGALPCRHVSGALLSDLGTVADLALANDRGEEGQVCWARGQVFSGEVVSPEHMGRGFWHRCDAGGGALPGTGPQSRREREETPTSPPDPPVGQVQGEALGPSLGNALLQAPTRGGPGSLCWRVLSTTAPRLDSRF